MVQGIMELLFDAAYLLFALTVGIFLIVKGRTSFFKLFGVMAVVLASGDSFHLVPRVYALLTDGLEANAFALGLGKLITSVTMTGFYVILYFILEGVMKPSKKARLYMRTTLFALAALRIILCAFPQNNWFTVEGSLLWGILRNIPFSLIGIGIIVICFMIARRSGDKSYSLMGWMVILSFGFYIPVVLFSGTLPIIGVLMIPKTLAYVGVVAIGLITNAIKYTPRGGNIDISLSSDGNDIVFTIANTGDSLEGKEELIFQPFYTTDTSGNEKGTGLGLPLVRKIVNRLGGEITLTTSPCTLFTVRLPIN